MDIREAIGKVIEREGLSQSEMEEVMGRIMEGEATPAQIAGFITGLRMKGETVPEITGAARAMRSRAAPCAVTGGDFFDTCGTGGDGQFTFNISTATALVAAGGGLAVAKHGNRSVSSRCGSADVLKELGVNIECAPEMVEKSLSEIGIAFFFAPVWHPAMKHAIGPRREIGVRTIFNILGPLTNPAGASRQLLGVYDRQWLVPLAEVLGELGAKRVMVVRSRDGLDEISVAGPTEVAELRDGIVTTSEISPGDFGFTGSELKSIRVDDPREGARLLLGVLDGEKGVPRDAVLINAGAALVIGGKADNLPDGAKLAEQSIDSGAAKRKLDELKNITGG